MVIYPYSELPELSGKRDEGYSTALQSALRYNRRLQSIHSELLDMGKDYRRDRTVKSGDTYYFTYLHKLRSEDIEREREIIEAEIDRMSLVISALMDCPRGCEGNTQQAAVQKALGAASQSVEAEVASALGVNKNATEAEFDDLLYWLRLPLPLNAVPAEVQALIASPQTPVDQKKLLFARYLFRHWIERQDSARCALYSECLSQKQSQQYYSRILSSFYAAQAPALVSDTPLSPLRPNARQVTIEPCTKVLITNSHSAIFQNAFTISTKDVSGKWSPDRQINIIDHDGGSNVNRALLSVSNKQELLVESWFFSNPFLGVSNKSNMWGSSARTSPLSLELRFWDSGSSADGTNLVVYFQAIPEPGPGCTMVNSMKPALQ
jgi:hypothetical protein